MSPDRITRREYKHGRTAYAFQWNQEHHENLGAEGGDLASLWAHLTLILSGKIPEEVFTDPFYTRASKLKLVKMSSVKKVRLRKRFMNHGTLVRSIEDPVTEKIREYHRAIDDNSYNADHSILQSFLTEDPQTIAIEVPVWSDRYKITGHIDLIRWDGDHLQICDYKPGPLGSLPNRFMESLPQISAYGEMMTHHLAGTLHSALDSNLLPNVSCCVFDSHSCWHFGSELFLTLQTTGLLDGL
jgi:hypothetical protein